MKNSLFTTVVLLLLSSIQLSAQNWFWAKAAGGPSAEQGQTMATDLSGNVYTAGYFKSSSMTFGSTTLANVNGATWEAFIVKHNSAGNLLWAKKIKGDNFEAINSQLP